MDFFNAIALWGLFGILAMAVPVVLHLLNRSAARETDWGAMRFLEESVAHRSRHIRLEDALLLSCRCLLLGLLAMALARPFIPPGASVPWLVILPLMIVAVVVFGTAMALRGAVLWRVLLVLLALVLLGLAGLLVAFEKRLNLGRFGTGGAQDIAVVLDTSASMDVVVEGQANRTRAVEEVRELLQRAPAGSAFSLIHAGSVPYPLVPTPVTDIEALSPALDTVTGTAGTMNAPQALRAAFRSLEPGTRPARQIVVFTDGQRHGWRMDDPTAWGGLDSERKRPRVLVRRLPGPESFANLGVTQLELSREVIGPDRPVRITATIANTGDLAVTPRALRLHVDEDSEPLVSRAFGSIAPGSTKTAVFDHRFARPGSHLITARLEVEDDLPRDNERPLAVHVVGGLSVLLIEGQASAVALERASAYAAAALSPRVGSEEGQLVETRVVDAGSFGADDLPGVSVVLLCDVPRLPKPSADILRRWVEDGGGLLIAPGTRVLPRFYDGWLRDTGEPFTPVRLGDFVVTDPEVPVLAAPTSFKHPALAVVADGKQSDIGKTLAQAYWTLEDNDRVLARWSNGDPFLAAGPAGEGRVVMLACGLDPSSSSLPGRLAFVPFLHELCYHLAAPTRPELNLAPSPQIDLPFAVGGDVLAIGPDGEARPVNRSKKTGAGAVTGSILPGAWRVSGGVDPAFADASGAAPFTVEADPGEGHLERLTQPELAALNDVAGGELEVVGVDTLAEIEGLLAGNKFGKELWKILLAGVFLLFIAEGALTRWISRRRWIAEP